MGCDQVFPHRLSGQYCCAGLVLNDATTIMTSDAPAVLLSIPKIYHDSQASDTATDHEDHAGAYESCSGDHACSHELYADTNTGETVAFGREQSICA